MASLASACRMSTRLVVRQVRLETGSRGYRTSAACLAAQNFTMPAMSPTMTEGNITSWKVKEGDSFSAGDVLLEIETDKAQMDVEAQDDGIMAKIVQGDGSKGIKVGTRIGVLAESNDDVTALAMPDEESAKAPSPEEDVSEMDPEKTSPSQSEAPPTSKTTETEKAVGVPDSEFENTKNSEKTEKPEKKKQGKAAKQTKPLLPSVQILMHQNGLKDSDVDKMTPTGPNNRLLKGDVMAYLGKIKASYPAELSTQLSKLTHLDLSNIKPMAQKAAPKKDAAAETPAPLPIEENLEVAIPVSMSAVIELQKRVETTLGVFMPLSTFIERASDFANEGLPKSRMAKPTPDELFNTVLGLHKVSSAGVRGHFMPQITALPSTAIATMPRRRAVPAKNEDIIDILSGKSINRMKSIRAVPGVATGTNIFSVVTSKEDEKRARTFLERVKTVLEVEPGRLVL